MGNALEMVNMPGPGPGAGAGSSDGQVNRTLTDFQGPQPPPLPGLLTETNLFNGLLLNPEGNEGYEGHSYGNLSLGPDTLEDGISDTLFAILLSSFLGILILFTIVGNVFVIMAILIERNLRTVGNYLVLSLAIADLLVACMVMPLAAVQEVTRQWKLGPELCDVWTSADVLCCTASILHLVAIALDRYWAVTSIDYIHNRNTKRIGLLIGAVWTVAVVISLAPILGWKDADFRKRIEEEKRCLVSQDVAYQVVACCATFYFPLFVILLLYWKIFKVARKRIRNKPGNKLQLTVRKAQESTSAPKSLSVPFQTELTTTTNVSSEQSTGTSTISPNPSLDKRPTSAHDNPATQAPHLASCSPTPSPSPSPSPSPDIRAGNGTKSVKFQLQSCNSSNTGSQLRSQVICPPKSESIEISSYREDTEKSNESKTVLNKERSEVDLELDEESATDRGEASVEQKENQLNCKKRKKLSNLLKERHKKEKQQRLSNSKGSKKGSSTGSNNTPATARESLEAKRERKAAKTLAIITGVFVVCWLPFFVVALVMPICGQLCEPPDLLFSFFLWLGYINSMLNPIIYTIFSLDFRAAFKKILCGRPRYQTPTRV